MVQDIYGEVNVVVKRKNPILKSLQKLSDDVTSLDVTYLTGQLPRKKYLKQRNVLKKHFESLQGFIGLK